MLTVSREFGITNDRVFSPGDKVCVIRRELDQDGDALVMAGDAVYVGPVVDEDTREEVLRVNVRGMDMMKTPPDEYTLMSPDDMTCVISEHGVRVCNAMAYRLSPRELAAAVSSPVLHAFKNMESLAIADRTRRTCQLIGIPVCYESLSTVCITYLASMFATAIPSFAGRGGPDDNTKDVVGQLEVIFMDAVRRAMAVVTDKDPEMLMSGVDTVLEAMRNMEHERMETGSGEGEE